MGANAQMGTEPECHVRVRTASDVEAERVVEDGVVAVRRRVQQDDPVAALDRLVADPVVGGRTAEEVVQGCHPPEDFLHGGGHHHHQQEHQQAATARKVCERSLPTTRRRGRHD